MAPTNRVQRGCLVTSGRCPVLLMRSGILRKGLPAQWQTSNFSSNCRGKYLFFLSTFLLPTSKGGVLPTQTQVHDCRCCKQLFSYSLARGGVLPTQTLVHHSRCCKQLLSYPLVRGDSNPPKLNCMTPDVVNDFSPAH